MSLFKDEEIDFNIDTSNGVGAAISICKQIEPIATTSGLLPNEYMRHVILAIENEFDWSPQGAQSSRNVGGTAFQYATGWCFRRYGCKEMAIEARLVGVHEVPNDLISQGKSIIYGFECKRSIRERWAKADRDAGKVKKVYKTSRYYLLHAETGRRDVSITNRSENLDACISVLSHRFNDLVAQVSRIGSPDIVDRVVKPTSRGFQNMAMALRK